MLADDERDRDLSEKRRHARAEVTLLVEYADADDLIGDYTDNLSSGGTFVATGRDALDLLRRRPFDAAIIDIYLPVIDGAHVIHTLRTELKLTIPVIAVSAGGPSVRELALEAGADMFIDKPMRLRHVIET